MKGIGGYSWGRDFFKNMKEYSGGVVFWEYRGYLFFVIEGRKFMV